MKLFGELIEEPIDIVGFILEKICFGLYFYSDNKGKNKFIRIISFLFCLIFTLFPGLVITLPIILICLILQGFWDL